MHKIAFQFGPLPVIDYLTVHWYGILVAAGFFVGLWTASRRALQDNIAAEKVIDMGPWLLVGAIIGARLQYVIAFWRDFFAQQPFWEIFMIHHGGLVYYGGLVGATLAGLLYVRRKQLPFWKVADILAPSIALGHALGRVGCLMNGCCYGRPANGPWAIHFPADHETHGAGVHPTQIYEATLNLAIYLALAWLSRRKKFEGQIFALYLVSYALMRAFVELFRGDYPPHYYLAGFITPAQLASGVFLAIGLGLLWQLPRAQGQRKSED